jgi:hypothetical protein
LRKGNGLGLHNSRRREKAMKKIFILMMVMMLALLTSVAMADENGEGKAGRLFLFQKCDDTLTGSQYAGGCPTGPGPWPIFFGKNRYGKMDYTLWGPTFKFSFEGKNLLPGKNYTLIYYADPWPGKGVTSDGSLICLGSGKTTPVKGKGRGKGTSDHKEGGNIEIHGNVDIKTSLPAAYDANFIATAPSGAVGAKIWLVLSDDVKCPTTAPLAAGEMINWTPTAYLFEYNLIVYERIAGDSDEE